MSNINKRILDDSNGFGALMGQLEEGEILTSDGQNYYASRRKESSILVEETELAEVKKEVVVETDDLNRLKDLLESHDWYYTYSDDIRSWKRGKKSIDEIKNIVQKIGSGADALLKKYVPRGFSI